MHNTGILDEGGMMGCTGVIGVVKQSEMEYNII